MKAGDKVYWRDLYAVVLKIWGETATIRIIGKKGRGNSYDVHFRELTSANAKPIEEKPKNHFLNCPQCGMGYPNYRQGIECPACHYQEHTRFYMKKFSEWMESLEKNLPTDGIDSQDYPKLPGLEGPFRFKNGKIYYYDPKVGQYYDRKTDLYIDNEEIASLM